MADVQDILNYQKVCTIQIQDNTRQLLNNAVEALTKSMQTYAVAVNSFTRQTDAGSDAERDAALAKLNSDTQAALDGLKNAVLPDVPDAKV